MMINNYLKITWRNLVKNTAYSLLNIMGLSLGMSVAFLIGLWIFDEWSYDRYFKNYDRIAKVMQRGVFEGSRFYAPYMPIPLGTELEEQFGDYFDHVVMSSWTREHILARGNTKLTQTGNYLGKDAPQMLSLKMLKGNWDGLKNPSSIFLAESVAKVLFGNADPMGKVVKIDNTFDVEVTGIYQDLPYNTGFRDMLFIAPWDLYVSPETRKSAKWDNYAWEILVQIAPHTDFNAITEKIKGLRVKHDPKSADQKPEIFLHPMRLWHLYTGWDKEGNLNSRIQYVRLFGAIGAFVLLLACINFMNMSTARSEKRAREVGVRKAVGSVRGQLVTQFFTESLTVAMLALGFSILLVLLALPFFNEVADKRIAIPWVNPLFWISAVVFTIGTGLLAGSYPAFYLSSFCPISVLKGVFRQGRLATMPRRVLVVFQFVVSVSLIVGTIVVFRQIRHAQNRPVGYDRQGLITVTMNTPELRRHYNALRADLLETGAVQEMSISSSPTTALNNQNDGFDWEGKKPDFRPNIGTVAVSHDFGRTVGWKFVAGRDFSRQYSRDSSGIVLNETAVRYMGLADPVGKTIRWGDRSFQVLGVIKDMIMTSPYEPAYQTAFLLDYNWAEVINIKLNPARSAAGSLEKISAVFRRFNPGSPFDYKFVDEQYALKFASEQRIGLLSSGFAALAILISCLGLFGMAMFTAEQRTKEIGVRKVMGASVGSILSLLSREFLGLVLIAQCIGMPIAYYLLNNWLKNYEYRTDVSWQVFLWAGSSTIVLTMLTVGYQSIKAALSNPVKSLRSE